MANRRAAREMALAVLAIAAFATGCPYRLPFVGPSKMPTVATAPGEFAVQSGVVQAATRHEGQYVRGSVTFPNAFRSDEVLVTVYPVDGAGKIAVMDSDARGFTYFILATIVNVPKPDGTFASHAEFYDGRIRWVAIGR